MYLIKKGIEKDRRKRERERKEVLQINNNSMTMKVCPHMIVCSVVSVSVITNKQRDHRANSVNDSLWQYLTAFDSVCRLLQLQIDNK